VQERGTLDEGEVAHGTTERDTDRGRCAPSAQLADERVEDVDDGLRVPGGDLADARGHDVGAQVGQHAVGAGAGELDPDELLQVGVDVQGLEGPATTSGRRLVDLVQHSRVQQ